jgi:ribosomal protein S18 acetylase RimI-like enzyme
MIVFKKADLSDSEAILEIARTTFSETFLEHNTQENLNNYLDNHLNLQQIKSQLENTDSVFYLARKQNDVVGYLKLNFAKAQTELQDEMALEIERIYVLKSFHGQKIGQLLMDKTIEVAKKSNLNYIFLGVWEHNAQGISFYKKNNFEIFDTHFFSIGADIQTDFLMKKTLT